MHPKATCSIFVLGLGIALAAASCKEQSSEPAKNAKSSNPTGGTSTSSTGDPSTMGSTTGDTSGATGSGGTGGATTDCLNTGMSTSSGIAPSISTTGNTGALSSTTLGLTDALSSFSADILPIVQTKCLTCHGPGNKPPDLTSFEQVRMSVSGIMSILTTETEPHDNLTTAEKRKIQAWVTAGTPEYLNGSTTGGGTTSIGGGTTSIGGVTDPCNPTGSTTFGGTTTGSSTALDWEDMINPPLLKECQARGQVYDRGGEKCHKARLATTYQCTRQGIIDKFKAMRVDISPNMAQVEGEGYQIDQCGEFNNEPLVLFYKKQEGTDELKLLFKKFCKKDSAACTN